MRFHGTSGLAARAALAALPLLSATARSEETDSVTARIQFERGHGAEGCLDQLGLESAVNRRWGRRVFVDEGTADILLRGTIERTGGGTFRASIELQRMDGTSLGSRELATAASDCSALDDSLALAIGLMLDVSRHRIVEERQQAATRAAETPTNVVSGPPIAVPQDTPSPRQPVHVEPFAGVEVSLGLLPGISLGPRIGIAIEPRRFLRIELAGSYHPPDEEKWSADRGARLSAWIGELAACPLSVRSDAAAFHLCVSERFGVVRAHGFGFAASRVASEPLSQLGVSTVATLSLAEPLALRLGLRGEIPTVRYRFIFTDGAGDTQAVFTMSPFVATADLELELRW